MVPDDACRQDRPSDHGMLGSFSASRGVFSANQFRLALAFNDVASGGIAGKRTGGLGGGFRWRRDRGDFREGGGVGGSEAALPKGRRKRKLSASGRRKQEAAAGGQERAAGDYAGVLPAIHGGGDDGDAGGGEEQEGGGRRGASFGILKPGACDAGGTLELRAPRTRDGRLSTSAFESHERSEKSLAASMAAMHVNGVSTRKAGRITEELCGRAFAAGTISNMVKGPDEERKAFAERVWRRSIRI